MSRREVSVFAWQLSAVGESVHVRVKTRKHTDRVRNCLETPNYLTKTVTVCMCCLTAAMEGRTTRSAQLSLLHKPLQAVANEMEFIMLCFLSVPGLNTYSEMMNPEPKKDSQPPL